MAGLKNWRKSFQGLSKALHNSYWVLLLLDGFEDQRPLSWLERAFRTPTKDHINRLLESKRIFFETEKYH